MVESTTERSVSVLHTYDQALDMSFHNIVWRKRRFIIFAVLVSLCGYLGYTMVLCCPGIQTSGVRLRQNLVVVEGVGSEDELAGYAAPRMDGYPAAAVDQHFNRGSYGGVKLGDVDPPARGDNVWEDEDDETDTDRDFERYDDEDVVHTGGKSVGSVARNKTNSTRKLPQAIIIGVKKCGTRALLEFIRLHPDVRAPGPEVHFFDRYYNLGLDWYRQQMPPTVDGQITMEKSPSYFVTRDVPRRIYNMSKSTKLLVVVRNPVTRAISDYTQTASKRKIRSFEKLAFVNNSSGVVDTSWGAIRIGVYAKHFEKWLDYFPLSSFLFVSGEELIRNPIVEMTKVQNFLGLKTAINEGHFYFNQTKGFPCLMKGVNSGSPHCLGKTKGRPHPEIDQTVLQRLHEFYRPFNAKFYQMVGMNFHWEDSKYFQR